MFMFKSLFGVEFNLFTNYAIRRTFHNYHSLWKYSDDKYLLPNNQFVTCVNVINIDFKFLMTFLLILLKRLKDKNKKYVSYNLKNFLI